MINYDVKDIALQRKKTHGFEEYRLDMIPNSIVVSDAASDLKMVDTSSFLANLPIQNYAYSSSLAALAYQAQTATTATSSLTSVSSSYATTASYAASASVSVTATSAQTAISASYAPTVPTISSSYAETASYALNVPPQSPSASWASQSLSSSFATFAQSAITANTATSSLTAVSASYAPSSPSISASYATTASFALNAGGQSPSASWASQSLSSSHLNTAGTIVITSPTGSWRIYGDSGELVITSSTSDGVVSMGFTGELYSNKGVVVYPPQGGGFLDYYIPKNTAAVWDSVGQLTSSLTTDTQIGYLSNSTGSIQEQLDGKVNVGDVVSNATTAEQIVTPQSQQLFGFVGSGGDHGILIRIDSNYDFIFGQSGGQVGFHAPNVFSTASWATNALNARTASFVTASNIFGAITNARSASFASSSLSASFVTASNVVGRVALAATAALASNAANVYIDRDTGSDFQPVVLTQFDGNFPDYNVLHRASMSYQPSTNTLRVASVEGTSSWANRAISASYAPSSGISSLSGSITASVIAPEVIFLASSSTGRNLVIKAGDLVNGDVGNTGGTLSLFGGVNNTGPTAGQIQIEGGAYDDGGSISIQGGVAGDTTSQGGMIFLRGGQTGTGRRANVGIGTIFPLSELHVSGSLLVDRTVSASIVSASAVVAKTPIYIGQGTGDGAVYLWSQEGGVFQAINCNDAGILVGTLGADYISVANSISAQGSISASAFRGNSFVGTASYALILTSPILSGILTTGSNTQNVEDQWGIANPAGAGIQLGAGTNVYLDGDIIAASGVFSGSLNGTASYANAALSASYAPSSPSVSASYALTASFALTAAGPFNNSASIGISIGDGTNYVMAGDSGFVTVPYNMVITSWTLLANASGSYIVNTLASTYDTYPVSSSITSTDIPSIQNNVKNRNLSVSLWTSSLNAGDILFFVVSASYTGSVLTSSATRLRLDIGGYRV